VELLGDAHSSCFSNSNSNNRDNVYGVVVMACHCGSLPGASDRRKAEIPLHRLSRKVANADHKSHGHKPSRHVEMFAIKLVTSPFVLF